ncbi:hypothetical protein [Variovorax atrisoli]|uniref:hypothetical protein n=1 Tax=Variovorax atrisoli TaxID=3394203 RepID=UPI001610BC3E|nr:hypothetical protein [Variovorax sp. BK613]MBB3641790.1 hypothetical protein [Variovorax sp. BK613]
MMDSLLTNSVFSLRLRAGEASQSLATRLRTFLSPYLWIGTGDGEPDLTVTLRPADGFLPAWRERCAVAMTIRETYAIGFTLKVRRGTLDDGSQLAWDADMRVGYRYDTARREVEFHGDETTSFIHLIELVRYFGLLVEQSKGTAILHSSAVLDAATGGVVAIAGIKGAGKTTTMLDLVLGQGHGYFSGDKLLLDVVDGRLRARGWPDYPHIGLGSLRQHPGLVERLGDEAAAALDPSRADADKILITPEAFAAALGRSPVGSGWLERIVLPEVAVDEALRSRALRGEEIDDVLRDPRIFEWPHTFVTSTWHGMPPADRAMERRVAAPVAAALGTLPWISTPGRAALVPA